MARELATLDVGPMYAVEQVASALRLSTATIYRDIRRGRLGAVRTAGGSIRISEAALLDYAPGLVLNASAA